MNNYNKRRGYVSILSDFSKEDLETLIKDNPYLRGYLQGYLAELALMKQLLQIPGVTSATKIPDSDTEKADIKVTYKDTQISIEVKSLRTDSVKDDVLNDTWEGKVSVKNSDKREFQIGDTKLNSTSLVKGQFDILAISCYAVNDRWEFVYMDNMHLPIKSSNLPVLIKTSFTINPETTPCLVTDLTEILESVYLKKQNVTVKI